MTVTPTVPMAPFLLGQTTCARLAPGSRCSGTPGAQPVGKRRTMRRTASIAVTLAALLALSVPPAAADPVPAVIGQFDWTEEVVTGTVFKVFNLSGAEFEDLTLVVEGGACASATPCLLEPLLIDGSGESVWPKEFLEPGSVMVATLSLVFRNFPLSVTLQASQLAGEDIRVASAPITVVEHQVPEPSAMSLVLAGLLVMLGRRLPGGTAPAARLRRGMAPLVSRLRKE